MTSTITGSYPNEPFFDPYNPQDPPSEKVHYCVMTTKKIAKDVFSKQNPAPAQPEPLDDDNQDCVIDIDITPSNEPVDIVENELSKITAMLKNPKCDIRVLIDQICRIAMALHRQGALENKTYVLDKELELSLEISNVKNTYNGWKVLTITIVSGGVTILGGVIGIAGVVPGTAAGSALAGMAPKVLSVFGNAGAKTAFSSISGGMGGIGQGTGAFGKIFENQSEAERAVHQFILNQGQTKLGDRNQASASEVQLIREALRKAEATDSEAHQTIKLLVDSRA
ncbi:MAG: hypothetical protein ACE5GN_02415 [Waddliaceae bacterium]